MQTQSIQSSIKPNGIIAKHVGETAKEVAKTMKTTQHVASKACCGAKPEQAGKKFVAVA